ncbi:hypothetical protein GCM10009765_21330 [Fodinicola feengrottensis]|uniref:Uncharacterized protein n=1 Tax=Fodinicola feengrottensis TaxID=435914 RepID=A0ABN2GI47_9ACTN
MRKLWYSIAVLALFGALGFNATAAQAGTASPKAPAGFTLLAQKPSTKLGRFMVAKLWYNNDNHTVHAELTEQGWFIGMHIVVAVNHRAVVQGDGAGEGPINTSEVLATNTMQACGWDDGVGGGNNQVCTDPVNAP